MKETYYGIYSNATVNDDESITVNFPVLPTAMELKDDSSNSYVSQVINGSDGDIHITFTVVVAQLYQKSIEDDMRKAEKARAS